MSHIKYVNLEEIDQNDLLAILNKDRVREHLVKHDQFDAIKLKSWIGEKTKIDSIDGCKVRGIISNDVLAGWCGIQFENGEYEIAIVLDEMHWGLGVKVFKEVLGWAKEFGHSEVYIHLLHTRPEYKYLRKISKNVFESELHGNKFTTYQIRVC